MSPPDSIPFQIKLTTSQQHSQLIAGLDDWLERGLLSNSEVTLTLKGDADHPELISGLEVWLQQGLIDDVTVRRLCRHALTCPLPVPEAIPVYEEIKQPIPVLVPEPQPRKPTWLEERWQSFQAELSLQWLLFLGVFMVVVSSGVLAASQWDAFSAVGQYGVLLGYTLCFWGVSVWAIGQGNLPLTARTLRMVALLLLPVNFWAMDGFGIGVVVGVIATIILSFMALDIGKRIEHLPLLSYSYLALSYLHWGWDIPVFPVIAVYLGVGVTMGLFLWRRVNSDFVFSLLFYSLGILFFRALFVAGVEISQLGLAIGASGWLLWWVGNASEGQILRQRVGGVLLLLGWLVTVGKPFPWQALVLSILAIAIFCRRLGRDWLRNDFVAVLVLGLQSLWLFWELIPDGLQGEIVNTATRVTNTTADPYALLSLVLFPYLVLIVGVSDWLHQHRKHDLGFFGDAIALTTSLLLITISFVNPLLLTLTLCNTTITLGVITQRRREFLPSPHFLGLKFLIYLTHLTGLLTIVAVIENGFPQLSASVWGLTFLALMVIEWGFSLFSYQSDQYLIWGRSSWHFGLGLAGLSYSLFWSDLGFASVLWLIAPLFLTFLASQTTTERRQVAAQFSTVGLVVIQPLAIAINTELTNLTLFTFGIAGVVMFLNTFYLRQVTAAMIGVGLWLGLEGVILYLVSPGVEIALITFGVTIALLWLLRDRLQQQDHVLAQLYAKAIDRWGILLTGMALLLLTFHSFLVYWEVLDPSLAVLTTGIIIFGAIVFRQFHSRSVVGIYALGWTLEVIVAVAVGLIDSDLINLAIANLVLGIGIQLFGDWWKQQKNTNLSRHWHIIPLLYGSLGTALRWGTFTRWTGVLTLAIALIFIGIGRRREGFKPLLYLALIGISLSAYETLFYQFSLSSGGSTGDGLILMSALGTTIVYAYRLLSPWLRRYLRLSNNELKLFANLHWLGSSLLLVIATTFPIEAAINIGLITGIFLIQHAFIEGRNNPNRNWGEAWVYAGFLEGIGMRWFWLSLPIVEIIGDSLVMWKGAIVSAIAYFLYILPWDNWGWSKRPWRIIALLIPLITILENPTNNHPLNYLFISAFYLVPAILNKQIRYTYISAVILIWLGLILASDYGLSDPLCYILPTSLGILYFAQIDPIFRSRNQRSSRHLWRCLGVGIICLVAFLGHLETGIVPGIITLIIIFAGLAFRVRAFLYIGTITFLLNATYQLGILIFEYPFSKWIIGLLVGIALIWLAATFETRREQIKLLLQGWLGELNAWE